jgi:hypothetical protein
MRDTGNLRLLGVEVGLSTLTSLEPRPALGAEKVIGGDTAATLRAIAGPHPSLSGTMHPSLGYPRLDGPVGIDSRFAKWPGQAGSHDEGQRDHDQNTPNAHKTTQLTNHPTIQLSSQQTVQRFPQLVRRDRPDVDVGHLAVGIHHERLWHTGDAISGRDAALCFQP